MEVIEQKLHPVLQKHTISISYNLRVDEYDAAQKFGAAHYFSAPVEQQEAMIAHVKARKVIESIVNYEAAEQAKKEAREKSKNGK